MRPPYLVWMGLVPLIALVGCSSESSAPLPKAAIAAKSNTETTSGEAPHDAMPPSKESANRAGSAPAKPPSEPPAELGAFLPITPEQLHQRIRSANPRYNGGGAFRIESSGRVVAIQLRDSGVADLSPLAGLPLAALDIMNTPVADLSPLAEMQLLELFMENTRVRDLSPLAGQPLRSLFASGSPVSDLSPLAGMPLTKLNLMATEVRDLSPLAGLPLQEIWLDGAPVSDLSPLAECPLLSITAKKTQVRDLSPLARLDKLEGLHIGETLVTDLSPLAGLPLRRLVFTPGRISTGIEAVRQITTLHEIGTYFKDPKENDLMPPETFWRLYDAGKIK